MQQSYVIGISGGSGSGKTSFIQRLRDRFPSSDLCVLSLDDYYRERDDQYTDENGVKNFDLPSSIDEGAFVKDVVRLLDGEVVHRKEYVFNNPLAKPRILEFKPAPILILEGIFIFNFEEIRDIIDLKIFIHAKENLKVIRRIKRDRIERNYPIEDVLYRYENHVLPTFEKYIEPYRELADVVINNNEHFEAGLELLVGFIEKKLQEIR